MSERQTKEIQRLRAALERIARNIGGAANAEPAREIAREALGYPPAPEREGKG